MHPRKLSSLAQDIENIMLNVLQLIPMSIVHPLLLEPIYVFLPTFYDVYHLSLFFYDLLESYKEAVQLENKKYIEVLQKNISYWTILVCHPIETFIDKKKNRPLDSSNLSSLFSSMLLKSNQTFNFSFSHCSIP